MAHFLTIVNGVPRQVELNTVGYEADYIVTYTIPSYTTITLPSSGTYNDIDLEVFLNGRRMYAGIDYDYVGSPPRTQVLFTFDLLINDIIKFRKIL